MKTSHTPGTAAWTASGDGRAPVPMSRLWHLPDSLPAAVLVQNFRGFGHPTKPPIESFAGSSPSYEKASMDRIESLGNVISAPEHQKSLTLAANDRAPGKARSFTREALTAWGVEDLLDQAVLIVSELTTNAERHGRTSRAGRDLPSEVDGEFAEEITLTLALQADVVGIAVEDNSPEPPVPQIAWPYATSGRGLHLVSAEADAWAACPKEDGRGKRVIALVKRPESPVTS